MSSNPLTEMMATKGLMLLRFRVKSKIMAMAWVASVVVPNAILICFAKMIIPIAARIP